MLPQLPVSLILCLNSFHNQPLFSRRMGLRKAWIYDSPLPATLAKELQADGHECSSSPIRRTSFKEKQSAMERYSLAASGDLVSAGHYEWARISVASRAHELRTRMKKMRLNGKRSCSSAISPFGEVIQREQGFLDGSGAWPNTGKAGEDGMLQETKPSSYAAPRIPTPGHGRSVSGPVVLNTIDNLMRHLESIGRLKPQPYPDMAFLAAPSPAQSIAGSETEIDTDAGNSSFASQTSTEGDSGFSSDN